MSSKVAQVVPLRRFPRNKGIFDYTIGDNLPIGVGDLVQINFKKSLVEGLVINISDRTSVLKQLKPINKLLIPQFLNKQQAELVGWLANYAGVSLAAAAQLAVPFNFSRRLAIESSKKISLKNKILTKPVNIVFSSSEQKNQIVRALVKKVLLRQQQVLLLVPEIYQIDYWYNIFKSQAVVYSGSELVTLKQSAWQNIRSGQAKIIIGTRAALWLNFMNLGGIIIDQPENENYIQSEQNPRYDALIVAKNLARTWQSSLALISRAPRLENWQAARQGQEQWQEFSSVKLPVKVIDLKNSTAIIKSGLISAELKAEVDHILKLGKPILFYLNRRGGATSSTCADCGFVARCPVCQRPLVLANNATSLNCFHCGQQQDLAIPCPACGSLQVTYKGMGLDKLLIEVKKIWPNKKIVMIEDKFDKQPTVQLQPAGIIIGSRTAVRVTVNLTLGLAILVKPDAELFLPEFRAVERLWQFIRNMTMSADKIIIQTHQINHYLWSSLNEKNLNSFYQAETQVRKKYLYPPQIKLTRFTCEHKINTKAQQQADLVVNLLKKHLPAAVTIIGPYPDYYRRRINNWRWHILIKQPLNFEPTALWPVLPADVIIDRDPANVLS